MLKAPMGFSCGIVGLPNVGKSTLFNALTLASSAAAENYPFCTIEPNTGEVAVPDERLAALADIARAAQQIPAVMSFVDIAGLVRGASKGEGLGNRFLGHIREADALVHLVRCFEDEDIAHVEGRIDPVADIEAVETELMLADMESLEKRQPPLEKKARGDDKDAKNMLKLVETALHALHDGKSLAAEIAAGNMPDLKSLNLLTTKKTLYACNVAEADAVSGNQWTKAVEDFTQQRRAQMIILAAELEAELSQLDEDGRQEYLQTLGLDAPSLHRLIRAGYKMLSLITYFTAGPKEARAWTITAGTSAPAAAGRIHSDFEKNFIRAEIVSYENFIAHQGAVQAAQAGKMRLEGKDYIVQDGDIVYFRTSQ